MTLAIFDLDGTLLDSNAIDSACFLEAFDRAFGLVTQNDWSGYAHHTDRGLTREFLRRIFGSEPGEEIIALHRSVFLSLLDSRMTRVGEIRGASAFLDFLSQRGWRLAIATGAWSESARLKLQRAGFGSDLMLTCCDAAESREEILRLAAGDGRFEETVVFGDGPWDVRAARNCSLPFVGVGSGAAVGALQKEGAAEVVADFAHPEEVLRAMQRAKVPLG